MLDMTRADLKRLEEELGYLTSIESQWETRSPIDGTIMTSDVVGKVGHYYEQGDFILEVANASVMKAEMITSENYRSRIAPGQRVALKIHAQPYQARARSRLSG